MDAVGVYVERTYDYLKKIGVEIEMLQNRKKSESGLRYYVLLVFGPELQQFQPHIGISKISHLREVT